MKNKKRELLKAVRSLTSILEDIILEDDIIKNEVLKKGDWIVIESQPESWSHHLNERCPLPVFKTDTPKYPLIVKIESCKWVENPYGKHLAASAGGYGWSLTDTYWRYATKEEIKEEIKEETKLKCSYKKGEFIWCRHSTDEAWCLRKATGELSVHNLPLTVDNHIKFDEIDNCFKHTYPIFCQAGNIDLPN